jgi:hypothetical protein
MQARSDIFLGGALSPSSQLMGYSRNSLEILDLLERLGCHFSKSKSHFSILRPKQSRLASKQKRAFSNLHCEHPARGVLKINLKERLSAATLFRGLFGFDRINVSWWLRGRTIIGCFLGSVLGLAQSVLHLAFNLFRSALDLRFRVTGPFSSLALDAPSHIFQFSFNSVLIHGILLVNLTA